MNTLSLRSAKQQLEHELGCLRLDHDHSKSDMESMENRHKNETDSYKSRLKRTEQLLEESRTEFLGISDAKSQLEREVNLLKLTQTKPLQVSNGKIIILIVLRPVIKTNQRHLSVSHTYILYS